MNDKELAEIAALRAENERLKLDFAWDIERDSKFCRDERSKKMSLVHECAIVENEKRALEKLFVEITDRLQEIVSEHDDGSMLGKPLHKAAGKIMDKLKARLVKSESEAASLRRELAAVRELVHDLQERNENQARLMRTKPAAQDTKPEGGARS